MGATELTVAWTPSGSLPGPEPAPSRPGLGARAGAANRTHGLDGQLDLPRTGARRPPRPPPADRLRRRWRPSPSWRPGCRPSATPRRRTASGAWSRPPCGSRRSASRCSRAAWRSAWLGAVAGERPARAERADRRDRRRGRDGRRPAALPRRDRPSRGDVRGRRRPARPGRPRHRLLRDGGAGPRDPRRRRWHPPSPERCGCSRPGAGAGSALAVAAAPLTWIGAGDARLSGIGDIGAGRWLVVLALGVIGGCALAVAQARAGQRRPVLLTAVGHDGPGGRGGGLRQRRRPRAARLPDGGRPQPRASPVRPSRWRAR